MAFSDLDIAKAKNIFTLIANTLVDKNYTISPKIGGFECFFDAQGNSLGARCSPVWPYWWPCD